ncbi:MAG: Gfo/Idh/MocA family oxidoreductase [Lactobacillales bacterium]|jgi:predicted dehydrogenase|nr:Gfo/Idh/MocA family oxidoreductase [Lactobacillales bacterium]
MTKVRYGIISTAQVVPRFIEAVRLSEDGEVVAVASRGLEKASQFADKWEIPTAYGSYEELYADEAVDVVYIATYNKGHFPAAKAALLAGKNVLLEKPFTLQLDEAQELFAIAEEKNLFLMEAQKSLFLPVTKQARSIIQSGKLGKIVWAQSVTAYPSIDHVPWFRELSAGGGTLHFSGSYPIEYLSYVLDKKIIEVEGVADFSGTETDTQSNLSLKFESGVLANIFITTQTWIDRGMKIIGTKGIIEIPDFWRTDHASVSYSDGTSEELTGSFKNEFVFEVNHVNRLIIQEKKSSPVMTKEMTLETVRITENMYKQWTKD